MSRSGDFPSSSHNAINFASFEFERGVAIPPFGAFAAFPALARGALTVTSPSSGGRPSSSPFRRGFRGPGGAGDRLIPSRLNADEIAPGVTSNFWASSRRDRLSFWLSRSGHQSNV